MWDRSRSISAETCQESAKITRRGETCLGPKQRSAKSSPTVGESGRSWTTSRRDSADIRRFPPSLVRLWQLSVGPGQLFAVHAELGPNHAKFGRCGPDSARRRPNSARCLHFGEVGQLEARIRPARANLADGRSSSDFGRLRPGPGFDPLKFALKALPALGCRSSCASRLEIPPWVGRRGRTSGRDGMCVLC